MEVQRLDEGRQVSEGTPQLRAGRDIVSFVGGERIIEDHRVEFLDCDVWMNEWGAPEQANRLKLGGCLVNRRINQAIPFLEINPAILAVLLNQCEPCLVGLGCTNCNMVHEISRLHMAEISDETIIAFHVCFI